MLLSLPTDPTLTLTSLTQLLVSVRKWDQLRQYLHIPRVVYLDIMGQYHDEAQRVQSWCEWYLTHHPAPSWLHVANGLYFCKEHNILDDLKSQVQYLKGGLNRCGSVAEFLSKQGVWSIGALQDIMLVCRALQDQVLDL